MFQKLLLQSGGSFNTGEGTGEKVGLRSLPGLPEFGRFIQKEEDNAQATYLVWRRPQGCQSGLLGVSACPQHSALMLGFGSPGSASGVHWQWLAGGSAAAGGWAAV